MVPPRLLEFCITIVMAVLVPEHSGLQHPPEDMANSKGAPANAVPNDLPATNETARETGSAGVPYPIIGGDGPDKDFYTKRPASTPANFSTDHQKEKFRKKDLRTLDDYAHDINRIDSDNLWNTLIRSGIEEQKLRVVRDEIRKWLQEWFGGKDDEWLTGYYWCIYPTRVQYPTRVCVISDVGFKEMWSEISLGNMLVLRYVLGEKNVNLMTQNGDKGLDANGIWSADGKKPFNKPQRMLT